MYKKSANPKVEELSKSWTERSYNLSDLFAINLEKGGRLCAWCAEGKLKHGNQKYCTKECQTSAMAWAYPQKEEALFFLLLRQDWKCNICQYDYRPLAEEIHLQCWPHYGKKHAMGEACDYQLIKRMKNKIDRPHRLEVDHINPIFKGGQSLGLDNHQAICNLCHRRKTSKDLKKVVNKSEDPQDT